MPVKILLDAAADLVDRGGAELDDVERVEHRDHVVEFVVEGFLIAGERLQRGDPHPVTELLAALTEPVSVCLRGPAGHQIEPPRPDTA